MSPIDEGAARRRRADELARKQRELEKFRDNIERLRKERAERLAEFNALTRGKDATPPPAARPPAPVEPLPAVEPPAPEESPAVAVPTTAPEVDVAVEATAEPVLSPEPACVDAGEILRTDDSQPSTTPESSQPGRITELEQDVAAAPDAPRAEPREDGGPGEVELALADEPPFAAEFEASRRRSLALLATVAAIAAVLAALVFWQPWRASRTDAPAPSSTPTGEPVSERPVAPPPAEPAVGAAPETPPAAAAPRDVAPPPARSRLTVELVTSRPVWVRAEVDGAAAMNRLVPAGETVRLEAESSVTVRLGDAGAVRLGVNGRDRGPAGRDGQVLTLTFDAADVEASGRE